MRHNIANQFYAKFITLLLQFDGASHYFIGVQHALIQQYAITCFSVNFLPSHVESLLRLILITS